MSVIPLLRRLRWQEVKTGLGYIVRLHLKQTNKNRKKWGRVGAIAQAYNPNT